MQPVNPTIVIVGITGDLAEKKLLPAIYGLAEKGLLGEKTKLYGTSRRPVTTEQIIEKLRKSGDEPVLGWLRSHLVTITADPGTEEGAATLQAATKNDGTGCRLFYLSIPPNTFGSVIECMANAGLNSSRDRIMIEKPFGSDLASAEALHKLTDTYYQESNVCRVDHYLAKPAVRDIAESGHAVFDPRDILAIDIRSDEALDVQGRGDFYEQTGALRDIVQSHLLQVLAVCMAHAHQNREPITKYQALESLSVTGAYRAQYEGYMAEVSRESSFVETYAALELTSSLQLWRHVRITLRSGKALPQKLSEISVTRNNKQRIVIDMNDNPAHLLDAYEQVLYDGAFGRKDLFLSAEEVTASWEIVQPTLEQWTQSGVGIEYYKKGTNPIVTV